MATKKISELSTYTESSISDATQALVPLDDLTVVGTGKTKHMSFAEQAKWFGSHLPKLAVNPGVALTASAPFTLSQNWNNNAVTFEGVKIVIDDDASAAASLPFQVLGGAAGTTNLLSVNKSGAMKLASTDVSLSTEYFNISGIGGYGPVATSGTQQWVGLRFVGSDRNSWIIGGANTILMPSLMLAYDGGSAISFRSGNTGTLYQAIVSEGANYLGIQNGTAAQNLSVYNTYTSGSVYERGRFGWNGSNVLQIGTEHVGGVARTVELIAGGSTRLSIVPGGDSTFTGSVNAVGDFRATQQLQAGNGYRIGWSAATGLYGSTDGRLLLLNAATNGFDLLQLGGITNLFPSIARSGANIQIKLADNSALTGLEAKTLTATGGTLTASAPSLNVTQTWNNSGVVFAGAQIIITDTASAAGSLPFQVLGSAAGNANLLSVSKAGLLTIGSAIIGQGAGTLAVSYHHSGISLESGGVIGWTNGTLTGGGVDTYLLREAANHLALRNSTNAQSFSVYGSYTSGSVYNRLRMYYDGSANYVLSSEHVGDSAKALAFATAGTTRVTIGTAGGMTINNGSLFVDNSIAVNGAYSMYWTSSTIMYAPTDGMLRLTNYATTDFTRLILGPNTTGGVSFAKSGTTVQVKLGDGSAFTTIQALNSLLSGYIESDEMTAPAAPAANKVRIYAEDNGAGKTRLMAIFPSGAAQQIAIEP